jgi:hypothetical protein
MLSNKRYGIARSIGQSVAYSNFVLMLNPKFRGKNFKWENLEDLAARMAASHVGLVGDFGKDHVKMQEEAAKSARYTIQYCFKESNVKEWLAL